MARIDRLWWATGGPGVPPRVESRRIKARVNAALDADPSEREVYMKQKIRVVLLAAALTAAIAGSAMAAGEHWDVLSVFFRGDTAPAQNYVDSTARTIQDKNYAFTVESSVWDGTKVYTVVEITALSTEAKEFLYDSSFNGMDLFRAKTIEYQQYLEEHPEEEHSDGLPWVESFGWGELDTEKEHTRRFRQTISLTDNSSALLLGLGYMEPGLTVEIPAAPVPSLTVEVGAAGPGIPEYGVLESSTLTIDQVVLSPLNCTILCPDAPIQRSYLCRPNLSFRMADGSIRTLNQMAAVTSSDFYGEDYDNQAGIRCQGTQFCYRFREVQALDNIRSVIVYDMEYFVDGTQPAPVEHDPALDPFTLPVTGGPLSEQIIASIPVRALTEALGGTCAWDPASGAVTCVYRGVTVVLCPGSETALVDGESVTMSAAPQVQDGVLVAVCTLFDNAWGIYSEVAWMDQDTDHDTVSGWYIVP